MNYHRRDRGLVPDLGVSWDLDGPGVCPAPRSTADKLLQEASATAPAVLASLCGLCRQRVVLRVEECSALGDAARYSAGRGIDAAGYGAII